MKCSISAIEMGFIPIGEKLFPYWEVEVWETVKDSTAILILWQDWS